MAKHKTDLNIKLYRDVYANASYALLKYKGTDKPLIEYKNLTYNNFNGIDEALAWQKR